MKSFIAALLVAAPISVWAQQPFHIQGTIAHLPANAKVELFNKEGMEPEKVAEAPVSNGSFTLTGSLRGPRICTVRVFVPTKKGNRLALYNKMMLMVGTDPITIKTDTTAFSCHRSALAAQPGIQLEGGELNRQYREFLDQTRAAGMRADSASMAAADAWFNNNDNNDAIVKERQAEEEAKKEYEQAIDDFIEAHPSYPVSAATVAQRFYNSFTYTQEQMKHWIRITAQSPDTLHVNFMRRNYDLEMALCLEAPYKDVDAQQKDGQTGKLSALMMPGKYTFVDFWASWCGPCRAAIPKVKAMSQDFADKLQVVSISVEEKQENWLKAEKEENMPCPQLWLNKEQMNRTASDYQISSIPRLVLISPEGKIVCVTHDPSLIREQLKK